MSRKATHLFTAGCIATAPLLPVAMAGAQPQQGPSAHAASAISVSYAKRAIRRYINKEYDVAIGPDFGPCLRLAKNKVRCEVSFKAGLYWRCGRVSVKNSGGYDYITARLPVGC